MITFIKRHSDILVINILGLIIGVVLYNYLDKKTEILFSILATSISLSIGIRSYNIENDKIFLELFQTFNNKYDEKFNDRLNTEPDKLEKEFIIDYLNLCSEEYLWYRKKRIPKDVWVAWRNGMEYHFQKPEIKKILLEEKKFNDSYYGLFNEIKI